MGADVLGSESMWFDVVFFVWKNQCWLTRTAQGNDEPWS